MLRKLALAATAALLTTTLAHAQKGEFGTAAEAKAMLEKAVAAVKADKAKALKAFNEGAEGFKDRDLYPICANASDGLFTAHPKLVGKSLKELEDKAGKEVRRGDHVDREGGPGQRGRLHVAPTGQGGAGAEGDVRDQGRRSGARWGIISSG